MCGEEHGPALLVFHQQVPCGSPGIRVHARRGFIQDHNLRTSYQGYADTVRGCVCVYFHGIHYSVMGEG